MKSYQRAIQPNDASGMSDFGLDAGALLSDMFGRGPEVSTKTRAVSVYLLSLLACSTLQAAEWVQTWGAAPLPPAPAMGPFPATPSFQNQTIRQIVRIGVGGERLRIRFTNEYGARP